jgi:hypothetical protein
VRISGAAPGSCSAERCRDRLVGAIGCRVGRSHGDADSLPDAESDALAPPSPSPSPTPLPFLAYKSSLNHYAITYPSGWRVSPGDKDHLDGFDSYDEARFYVGRQTDP